MLVGHLAGWQGAAGDSCFCIWKQKSDVSSLRAVPKTGTGSQVCFAYVYANASSVQPRAWRSSPFLSSGSWENVDHLLGTQAVNTISPRFSAWNWCQKKKGRCSVCVSFVAMVSPAFFFHHVSRSKALVMSTVSAAAAECALAGGDARRRWLMVTMPRIASRGGQSGHGGWFGGPLAASLYCQAIGSPLRRQLCIIGWCSVGRGGMTQHNQISKREGSAKKNCIPLKCAIKITVQRASKGACLRAAYLACKLGGRDEWVIFRSSAGRAGDEAYARSG